jgi:hypothetical protein
LEKGEQVGNDSLSKGILYCSPGRVRAKKLVVPAVAIPTVFAYFHDSPLGGHLGVFKTINKIHSQFIWQGMDNEIRNRVHACQVCGLSKPAQNTRLGLLASEAAERPMQKFFIDYVGKFPRSKEGNTVCVDAFTKFVWLIPVREATT